jgi:hypothetical protein
MKRPNTHSRRPTFRWGDVEDWVRTLSAPKIDRLHTHCIGLIARFEFARSNPAMVCRFDGTPDLSEEGLSLEFVMFKRRLRLDHNAEALEYVLNFSSDPILDLPKKRNRSPRGREGKAGSGAAAQAAAVHRPRRRRRLKRVLFMWYKTCLRTIAILTESSAVMQTMRTTSVITVQTLRDAAVQVVHRSPQLRLDPARIKEFFMGLPQPWACVSVAATILTPRVYVVGAGISLLLHSYRADSQWTPWELAPFGDFPLESEQMLA